MSVNVKNILK